VAKLDRRKYAWDVMEHVVGGVRATDKNDDTPRTHVVDLGARRSFGGAITSTVHLIVVRNGDDAVAPARDDDEDESR
jgi:hypothetical protein